MIKQVSSGLYCAISDGTKLAGQPVVLSCVPTVWCITDCTGEANTVRYAVPHVNSCVMLKVSSTVLLGRFPTCTDKKFKPVRHKRKRQISRKRMSVSCNRSMYIV